MYLKLFCIHFNECDPKKCTAIKLKKYNLVTFISKNSKKHKEAILLTPVTHKVLSIKDRETILKHGLVI